MSSEEIGKGLVVGRGGTRIFIQWDQTYKIIYICEMKVYFFPSGVKILLVVYFFFQSNGSVYFLWNYNVIFFQ